MDNEARVDAANGAIYAYLREKDGVHHVLTLDEIAEGIRDLITDLGHLAQEVGHGHDFLDIAALSIGTWSAERRNMDPAYDDGCAIVTMDGLTGLALECGAAPRKSA